MKYAFLALLLIATTVHADTIRVKVCDGVDRFGNPRCHYEEYDVAPVQVSLASAVPAAKLPVADGPVFAFPTAQTAEPVLAHLPRVEKMLERKPLRALLHRLIHPLAFLRCR